MNKLGIAGALLALACTGCTLLKPVTTVVLVEDPNGKVGRVMVENDKKQVQDISKKNMAAVAGGVVAAKPKVLTDSQVNKKFATTLKTEPEAPARIKLHFDSGSSQVVAEDLPLVDKSVAEIKRRNTCDTSVIGNSDSEGDYESNKKLSLERAEAVAALLVSKGADKACMDIRFYADNDPIVKTPKGVGHPQNRRVEVEVR